MAEEKQRELRVVMFPWLAYGHITPFMELAKSLASHGLKIFFVSTPLNIQRIKPQMCDAPGIDLVELALPSVEGLPAGVESTAEAAKGGKGPLLLPLLIQAMELLDKPFEALLRQLSPHVVIHDSYWIPPVAAKLGIPTIFFLILGMASFSFLEAQLDNLVGNPTAEDLIVSPPGFPSQILRRPLFEARKAMRMFQKQPDSLSFAKKISIGVRESSAVVCNTCMELEGVYVDYFRSFRKRPVFPVGILMPKLLPRPAEDSCLQWLDSQPAASVVFVSFGSESPLAVEEVAAMAMGLQQSSASFLWLLLSPNGLPTGFEDEIRGKGLLLTKWAPQLHILNHPSIGAFLTHCGWNSITEGLRFGVPLIALPIQFDQGLNAKLAQKLNVAVEVRRNEENGSFTQEDISKAIKVIMIEEEGERIKFNVTKISNMLSSNNFEVYEKNVKSFVSMIKTFEI